MLKYPTPCCGGPEGRDSPNVLRDNPNVLRHNPNVLCDNPDVLCDNATMPRYSTFYVTIPTFYAKVSNIHVTIPTFDTKVSNVLCDNVLTRPVLIRATPQKLILAIKFTWHQLSLPAFYCWCFVFMAVQDYPEMTLKSTVSD